MPGHLHKSLVLVVSTEAIANLETGLEIVEVLSNLIAFTPVVVWIEGGRVKLGDDAVTMVCKELIVHINTVKLRARCNPLEAPSVHAARVPLSMTWTCAVRALYKSPGSLAAVVSVKLNWK